MPLLPRIIGERCKDEGKCHHSCSPAEGCFREACCVPLSGSGLDDQWRAPEERAAAEARALEAGLAHAPRSERVAAL